MGEEVEEKIATVSVVLSDALRSAANYEERRAAAPITPADNPIVVEQRIKLMREAADTIESLRASLTRVEEERDVREKALYFCMVGGNHIASALIGRLGPSFSDNYPHTAEYHVVLESMGAGDTYDMWCCWSAIMRARDIFEATRLSRDNRTEDKTP